MMTSRFMNAKNRRRTKLGVLGFQLLAGAMGAAMGLLIIYCLLTAMV